MNYHLDLHKRKHFSSLFKQNLNFQINTQTRTHSQRILKKDRSPIYTKINIKLIKFKFASQLIII